MLTLNEAYEKTKDQANRLYKSYQKVTDEVEILGIHEAATKLWIALVKDKNNKEEFGKRIANVLIGAFVAADKLGIKNIESCFSKRLAELEKALKK